MTYGRVISCRDCEREVEYSPGSDCIWSVLCLKKCNSDFVQMSYDKLEIVLFLQGSRKEGPFILDFSQNMGNLVSGFSLNKPRLNIVGAADVSRAHTEPT